jgi:hypothetical protein
MQKAEAILVVAKTVTQFGVAKQAVRDAKMVNQHSTVDYSVTIPGPY